MGDRELLELAAKAVGIELVPCTCSKGLLRVATSRGYQTHWDPLTDDGEALRLAAVLELEVSLGQCGGIVYKRRPMKENIEELSEDYMAAIRRAIVRAAAEIGRAM